VNFVKRQVLLVKGTLHQNCYFVGGY